ncbi:MAG TPA: PilZ domain-containing protein [Terriglobales bacterium]|nr:PilZ domain-containing protein [Terriglobales bacterium]
MTHEPLTPSTDRTERRIHVALPVRVTYYDNQAKPRLEMACTYDISAHGARVTGLRCVKEAGEILVVERGRSKAFCRVVWIGEANSHLRGQVGIQCVEAQKTLWAAELRDMEEVYDPIVCDRTPNRVNSAAGRQNGNRRRHQRLPAEGAAELQQKSSKASHLEGSLRDVSELGCLVTTKSLLLPGTDLKLVLNVANYDLSFKGQVRHAALDVGLGIEFREVRKGDRDILQYLLRKLGEKGNFAEGKREKPQATSATTVR